MTTAVKQKETKKTVMKAVKQPASHSEEESKIVMPENQPARHNEEASKIVMPETQTEVRPGVQPAYQEYVHARRGVASAFNGRISQDRVDYEEAQRQYQAYEQAIDQAVTARYNAEHEALEAYRQAVEEAVKKASEDYRLQMKQAMVTCKKKTEEVWKGSMETSIRMKHVFENDDVLITKPEQPKKANGITTEKISKKMLVWKSNCAAFFRKSSKIPGRIYAKIAQNNH